MFCSSIGLTIGLGLLQGGGILFAFLVTGLFNFMHVLDSQGCFNIFTFLVYNQIY